MIKKIATIPFFLSIILKSENLALIKIADVPPKANFITQPLEEEERLFILNQKGFIYIINKGKILEEPFLNISDKICLPLTTKCKEGLLGLAFDPNYKKSGYFYVHYIDKDYSSVVSRFSVTTNPDKAELHSEKIILKLRLPNIKRLGGHITFGPKDEMLYIGYGSENQSLDLSITNYSLENWLGTILRIDVRNNSSYTIPIDNPFKNIDTAEPEIFCYGIKNPYRFSFDKKTNDLIIGDVGQRSWEEINWNTWDESKGANFGWPVMEGNYCYDTEDFCDTSGLTPPTFSYPNNTTYFQKFVALGTKETIGCAVIGGYVYRGEKHPSLWGSYVFGDYCSSNIWALKKSRNNKVHLTNLNPELKRWSQSLPISISSFGEDNLGELYVVDYMGAIYKFISN